MKDCIFCKIVKGESPSRVRGETKNVIAFDSIAPVSEHHILLVPKKHFGTFLDIKKGHRDLFMEMAKLAQELIKKNKISGGYRLVVNGGKYQAIDHFHWHLLGGKLEDEADIVNKT
ncbi:HIT domain-containing protein [Candidatus Woesebacteria bacterium]|nr:HIT domain-containing protein [Candidatus Woesebacteria bacterium]